MHIFDQAALTFAAENTEHIEREVNETVYPDILYPSLIPVDTSAPAFAETVTFYTSDKYGRAEWINGNADDIPLAGSELSKQSTQVHMAAIGYGWGYAELQQAMLINHPLAATDALAARRAYEEFVERLVFEGDSLKGIKGILDSSAVTATVVPNGNWQTANADDIVADINYVISGIQAATANGAMADTLLLPVEKMNILSSKRMGDTTMTLLAFIKANNLYTAVTGLPLTIRAVKKLSTAGVGGTARLVAYRRDPSVLKLHMPMPHTFLPVYQPAPLRFEVAGVFRLAGLDIRKPDEVRYGDGI